MDTTLDRRGKDGVDEIIAIKVDERIDIDIDIRIDKGFYGTEANRTASASKVAEVWAKSERHPRRVGFQEEFRRVLAKYGVEFDERYVWD